MSEAIVIGSGFGGLAGALRLQSMGYDTTIYERLDQPGGRAGVKEINGYTFDLGPTIITAPFLLRELFELFNKDFSNYVNLKRLDPWYQIRYEDGRQLPFRDELTEMKTELEKFSKGASKYYQQFLQTTRRMFKIGFEELGTEPFDSVWTMIRVIPELLSKEAYKTVWDSVKENFNSSYLRKAFSFHPLLVGGNPLTTSSIYRLIHALERKWGVHYSMGGTTQIIQSLVTLFQNEGGTIHYNTTIDKIQIEDGCARGVSSQNDDYHSADLIVSNVDPATLYTRMISDDYKPSGYRKPTDYSQSMGLFVLYFGTDKTYDHLHHHEILLTETYCDMLEDIFKKKKIPEDLNMYLHRPTATDPDAAPSGHDAMYVLVPVPNLRGQQDWSEIGKKLKNRVIKRLEKRVCPGLKNSITTSFFRTPEDFRKDYWSFQGNGFSVQPTLTQSAWFRFHNNASIKNLSLVGAGTHPGAGVPGVLCSAKVMQNSLTESTP